MTSITEIYETAIKPLPASQRLGLAKMILSDIAPDAALDDSEEWTEEGFRDFSASSMAYIDRRLEEEERGVQTG